MLHVKIDRLSRPANAKGIVPKYLSIQFYVHVQNLRTHVAMSTSMFVHWQHCGILCGVLGHWKKN